MRVLLAALLLAVAASVHAQPRAFSAPELEALLAPVALYPDDVVDDILVAATYPEDVRAAAAWLRANPSLQGDDAVRAAEPMPWHPSLKSLLAFPDLVARMDESPQWLEDLGDAYLAQQAQVMASVQVLRQRAQASGYLSSDGYQSVERENDVIVVQPVQSGVVYLPWYNPLVVYGGWWHAHHRPIFWRPWHPHIVHVHRPIHVHNHVHKHRPIHDHRRIHAHKPSKEPPPHIHNHVHQAQKARPIVQGARIEPPIEHRKPQFDRRAGEREHRRIERQHRPVERRNADVERRQIQRPPHVEQRHIQRPVVQGRQADHGPRFRDAPRQAPRGEARGGGHRSAGRG